MSEQREVRSSALAIFLIWVAALMIATPLWMIAFELEAIAKAVGK